MGSYFGVWRWPVIYIATLYGALALWTPRKFLQVAPASKRAQLFWWGLFVLLLGLGLQGGWMWYNAKYDFYFNEIHNGVHHWWYLEPKAVVPFPDLPGAVDREEAWDKLSYLIPCGMVFLGTLRLLQARVLNLGFVAGSIFWAGVAVATLGLLQRFTGAEGFYWNEEWGWEERQLFFATFRSPAIVSAYLNLCFSLGLGHLLATMHKLSYKRNAKPTIPILMALGVITVFAGAVAAGSKAGAFFAVASLLLWFLLAGKQIWRTVSNASSILPSGSPHERNLIVLAAVVAGVFAALSFSNTVAERWEKSVDSNHSTMQVRHLVNAVQLRMLDDPEFGALGYGPGSFYPLFEERKKEFESRSLRGARYVYAHNDYLQTWIEWGIVGVAAMMFVFGGGLCVMVSTLLLRKRQCRTYNRMYYIGALVGMLSMLTHASIDFPLQIESIAITVAAATSILWRPVS